MTPMIATEEQEAREILDRAMKLLPTTREKLAWELFESVNPPPNSDADRAYWRAEIARRIEAVENGTAKTYTPEEVHESIRKALAADRQQ